MKNPTPMSISTNNTTYKPSFRTNNNQMFNLEDIENSLNKDNPTVNSNNENNDLQPENQETECYTEEVLDYFLSNQASEDNVN